MTDWNSFWLLLGSMGGVFAVLGSGVAYFVKTAIINELERFENNFLERLNGRYVSSELFESIMKRGDERHESVQKEITQLYHIIEKRP